MIGRMVRRVEGACVTCLVEVMRGEGEEIRVVGRALVMKAIFDRYSVVAEEMLIPIPVGGCGCNTATGVKVRVGFEYQLWNNSVQFDLNIGVRYHGGDVV